MSDISNILIAAGIITAFLYYVRIAIKLAAKEELKDIKDDVMEIKDYTHRIVHDLRDEVAKRDLVLQEALEKLKRN